MAANGMASLLPATLLEDRSDHPSTQHSLTSLRPGARSADLKMTGASSAYHAYPDLQLASLHPIYSVSLVDPSARLYTATSKVDPLSKGVAPSVASYLLTRRRT